MEECSSKMFRGSAKRPGISSLTYLEGPSLQWIAELGPMVALPIYDNDIVHAAGDLKISRNGKPRYLFLILGEILLNITKEKCNG